MALVAVRIEEIPLNEAEEYRRFCSEAEGNEGAIVAFTGKVRQGEGYPQKTILHLTVEHYPVMTEKLLARAANAVAEKHNLMRLSVIHRSGRVLAKETIVLVLASGVHRAEAFAATQEIMLYLKKEIPLWKKETSTQESVWVKPPRD